MLDIPSDELSDFAVLFYDTYSRNIHGVQAERGASISDVSLGAAAMGAIWGVEQANRRAYHWLHKFDRRENEARRNEALANEFSMVTVDQA